MDNPPATNIHTIVKAQIVFLLSTLTEENFERNQLEIRSVRRFGRLITLFQRLTGCGFSLLNNTGSTLICTLYVA